MKLTNAYIIDGDVIEKIDNRLIELNKIRVKSMAGIIKLSDSLIEEYKAEKSLLEEIKQHLKPALPIVEEAFNNGIASTDAYAGVWELIKDGIFRKDFQDFLTKDF